MHNIITSLEGKRVSDFSQFSWHDLKHHDLKIAHGCAAALARRLSHLVFKVDNYLKSEIQQSNWALPNRSPNAKKIYKVTRPSFPCEGEGSGDETSYYILIHDVGSILGQCYFFKNFSSILIVYITF